MFTILPQAGKPAAARSGQGDSGNRLPEGMRYDRRRLSESARQQEPRFS